MSKNKILRNNVKSQTNISITSLPDTPQNLLNTSANEGFKKMLSPRETFKVNSTTQGYNKNSTAELETNKSEITNPRKNIRTSNTPPVPTLALTGIRDEPQKFGSNELPSRNEHNSNEISTISQNSKGIKSTLISTQQRKILGGKLAEKIRKDRPMRSDKSPRPDVEDKCQICFENSPDGVFMNCGHGGLCTSCAFEMVTIKPECHLCREEIKQVVQLKYPNHFKDVYQAICITDIVIEHADESIDLEQNSPVRTDQNVNFCG